MPSPAFLTSQPCWLIPHSPSMIPTGRCPCVWSRNSGLSRRPVCITRIAITTRYGESRGARRRDRNSEGWSWTISSVSARSCGVVSARVSVGESTVLDLASFLLSFSHPLILSSSHSSFLLPPSPTSVSLPSPLRHFPSEPSKPSAALPTLLPHSLTSLRLLPSLTSL